MYEPTVTYRKQTTPFSMDSVRLVKIFIELHSTSEVKAITVLTTGNVLPRAVSELPDPCPGQGIRN